MAADEAEIATIFAAGPIPGFGRATGERTVADVLMEAWRVFDGYCALI